jgi:hypothetical protein
VAREHPESEAAPEAACWTGVSSYKGSGKLDTLKQAVSVMRLQMAHQMRLQEARRLLESVYHSLEGDHSWIIFPRAIGAENAGASLPRRLLSKPFNTRAHRLVSRIE